MSSIVGDGAPERGDMVSSVVESAQAPTDAPHAEEGNGALLAPMPASTDASAVWSPPVVNAPNVKTASKGRKLREGVAGSWVWRSRGLLLGLAALGLAMYAQKLLTVDKLVVDSIRWYALAIIVMLVAWAGTYRNKSCLATPTDPLVDASTPPVVKPTKEAVVVTPPLAPEPKLEAPQPRSVGTTLPVRSKLGSRPAAEVSKVVSTLPVRSKGAASAPASPVYTPQANAGISARANLQGWLARVRPQQPAAPSQDTANSGSTSNLMSVLGRIRGSIAWPRYLLAALALGLNLYCVGQLRLDYFSPVGGFGWLLSLALLAMAFMGERRKPAVALRESERDVEDRNGIRLLRRTEIFVVGAIMLIALALRLYRLGDLTGGMHGDEGETGMDALNILMGNRVSPFTTGWFSHGNFSFWSIALTMGAVGKSLFGLRLFSVLLGVLTILPFYGLTKGWFGARTAVIASVLLAVMDVSLYFGRLGLNNITTPFFLVTGFYFFFRGLQARRTLDFILAGYSFMLTMYFYFGGRLTPYIVAALLGYIFLVMPLLRVPGAFLELRKRVPGLGWMQALRGAAWGQARTVLQYGGQIVIFVVACVCFGSPWYVYYQDNKGMLEARPNDKLIFTPINEGRMASQHNAQHSPLYLGLRMPRPEDIYPVLPVVFEQTPISVKLTDDGFWPRAIWGQTTTTLSIFTYRADASSFYTFTGEPATKPFEAVFLILGIAWAAWRWRDTRMATLSLWFWATLLAGGVLTIDAPYMPRMVGLVPTLAIFVAIPLNKLASELIAALGSLNLSRLRIRPHWQLRAGQALTGALVSALLAYLGMQNYSDYFGRYLNTYAYPDVAGQAYFVSQMNNRALSEGRPTPKYYDLGVHNIYWAHGDNRFLNNGTEGQDMTNPSNELPVINNGERDVIFMVWPHNAHYLPIFKAYYPEGEETPFVYGPPGAGPLFTAFRVKKEHLEAQRKSIATYTPANGPAIAREETALGTVQGVQTEPPDGLTYPLSGEWRSLVVAPAFGRYRFSLDTPQAGSLVIDGQKVLTATGEAQHVEVELLLARGPHEVVVSGELRDSSTQALLQWSAGGTPFAPVSRENLYLGPARGLLGSIRPNGGAALDAPQPTEGQPPVLMSRIDGFLGFRHSPDALGGGSFQGAWTGTLTIKEPGPYGFDVFSNGDSVALIDGQIVVRNIQGGDQPHSASGSVELAAGAHSYELRYNFSGGTGYLEAYWTPPGGQRSLLSAEVLSAAGGVVDPSAANEPPPVQLQPPPPPAKIAPDAVIGRGAGLLQPRGLGIDKAGNIYVGDKGNGRIVVFAPDGTNLRTWGKPPAEGSIGGPGELSEIKDLAVGADGNIYVLEGSSRIQVFTPAGEVVKVIGPDGLGMYGANGIAVGPDGSIFVGDTGKSRVLKLPPLAENKPPDVQESFTGGDVDKLEQPVDAVVDPTNPANVYAIDLKDRIVQLDGSGTVTRQWRLQVGRDEGGSRLAFSPDGSTIYMSDPDRQRVAVLKVEDGALTYFGQPGTDAGQFRSPSGVAVAPDGRVYVLDRINSVIQVFTIKE